MFYLLYIYPPHRYAPAYERFGSQISVLHYIGCNKPWNELPYRPPFAGRESKLSDVSQPAYDYDSLVDRWFEVYDRHYRTNAPDSQTRFEVKPYPSAWDQPMGFRRPVTPPNTFDLDELKRLAIAGLNTSSPGSHSGEGMYNSMPLEGRIDLMRPRKPVKEDEVTVEPIIQPPPLPTIQIPSDDRDGFPSESFSYDEAISTPQARQLHLHEHGKWQTLPTPAPHDVPFGSHMNIAPLPFTPTPLPAFGRTPSDFYASESESEGLLLAHPPSRPLSATALYQQFHPHQHGNSTSHPYSHQPHQPPLLEEKRGSHFQKGHHAHGDKPPSPGSCQHLYLTQVQPPSQDTLPQVQVPQRTTSPPLLPWNPALEPPPSTVTPNTFPSDTYFANAWDQTLSKHHYLTMYGSTSPDSSRLFQPPPTPTIPVSLIKQGHYRNVTGDSQDVTPSPDRQKVKSIFPWEVKPRPLPGRVFPDSDVPPPSLFLSPGSQTSTIDSTTPEMRGPGFPNRTAPLSPIHGLQTSLAFVNAWDSIPSIQKYATKLVKPPPPPLAPAFEDEVYRRGRRKSRDEHSVSSRDGDDEDNADDEDEGEPVAPSATKWDDEDSEGEATKRRSRRDSIVSATLNTGPTLAGSGAKKTKRYRDQGVQTTVIEKRSRGIQVDLVLNPDRNRHQKRTSMPGKRHLPANDLPPATGGTPVLQPGHKKSPSVSPPLQSPVKTTREFLTPPSGNTSKEGGFQSFSPPLLRSSMRSMSSSTVTGVSLSSPPPPSGRSRASSLRSSTSSIMRRNSNDSSVGSPASSYGPLSPLDVHPTFPLFKKGGRVWDPARGVELFKKGSEEVLAKFLSMAAVAEEAH